MISSYLTYFTYLFGNLSSLCFYLYIFLILFYFFHILLSFKYSCLRFPPTTLPYPNHPHFPPLLLPSFGFVHVSFIHVPDFYFYRKCIYHNCTAMVQVGDCISLWRSERRSQSVKGSLDILSRNRITFAQQKKNEQ